MVDSQEDQLIGRLALHYKLLSQEQLTEASRQQALAGGRRKLAEVLVESGLLTPRRCEQLLAAHREMVARRQASAEGAPAVVPIAPAGPAAAAPPPAAPAVTAPAVAAPTAGGEPAADAVGRPKIDRILDYAVHHGASDLHLHSGAPVVLRRFGRLQPVEGARFDAATIERAIAEILSPEQQTTLAESGQIDLAYTVPGLGRFRTNVYRQQRGLDAVFRAIPPRPPTLAELGLPPALARLANFHQGLVLITGPAGCGKSSTMAAMLNIVNEERRDHIITIEDPIEYLHPSKKSLVNQRQVGRHTGSFARALRAALREDPDVIGLGELRDLETISLALTAAETGHLVLATLHTNNAIRTVNRILGVFPPLQQEQVRTMLSESLRAIVSQRLVVRADGTGRVPAIEVLISNRAVGNLIRENKTFQIRSVLQTGAAQGMCLLDASLADLVKAGTITRQEAQRHAEDPAKLAPGPGSGPGQASARTASTAGEPAAA